MEGRSNIWPRLAEVTVGPSNTYVGGDRFKEFGCLMQIDLEGRHPSWISKTGETGSAWFRVPPSKSSASCLYYKNN